MMAELETAAASASSDVPAWAKTYASWLLSHCRRILVGAAVLAAAAGMVAMRLPVHADFSYLLPPSATSVQHLRALEKRARVLGTVMLAVQSEDAAARQRAAYALRQRLLQLEPSLRSDLTFDAAVSRHFGWENRWLFADLDDLRLVERVTRPGLRGLLPAQNPLLEELEGPDLPPAEAAAWAAFKKRLKHAAAQKDDPGELISDDGKLQLMVLQTPFSAGDVGRDATLLARLDPIVAEVMAQEPAAHVGLAGDVLTSTFEHHAILAGMLQATAVTLLLVLLGLWLYYRSAAAVASLAATLGVGVLATFAITRLTIGFLNVATAFLASIVVGNGINFGIMLLSRYAEARRQLPSLCQRPDAPEALALAIAATWRATLAAALTAAVAYMSLMVTDFRGFFDFGWIGGTGMVLCWLVSYTVLPACLAWAQLHGLLPQRPEPALGRWLARLLPQRPGVVCAVGLVVTGICLVMAVDYLVHDPYEANFKNLRSDSPPLLQERTWMHRIDQAFGQGISGGFVIGLPERARVPKVVATLRDVDVGKSREQRVFSRINALDDMLPAHQAEKLALVRDIATHFDDAAIAKLSRVEQRQALALRPPAMLRPLVDADVPLAMAWPFTELDGTRGRLILAMSGFGYDIWNAHDLVRFSDQVRALNLGDDVLLGGQAFVFADMLRMVEHDGPRATLAAMLGAAAVVVVLVGAGRYGLITLLCGAAGTLTMLAIAALCGLRVNFLDFVALPITIGIGIDYAVNICARARLEGGQHARQVLATSGGAVFLCSYTTIIGYGSLLLSSNKGIRSFGMAAILGEVTCLVAALVLAPALLQVCSQWRDGGRAAA